MEIVFNREALLATLKLASAATARSGVIPILQKILVVATDERVSIRATDNEVALDITCEQANVTGGGVVVCLPAGEFTEAVARCEDETITLRRAEGCVQIVISNGRYEFNLIDGAEFPTAQFGFDIAEGWELKLADLQHAIGKVLHVVDLEATTRYSMDGVLAESSPEGLNLVATDGRRLAKAVLKTKTQLPAIRTVVSKKTMEILRKMEADGDTKVRIEFTESNIFCQTDTAYLCGLVLDSKFPKYIDIIPTGCEHSIKLDAAKVAAEVRRTQILANEDEKKTRTITIISDLDELLFDSRNPEVGKAEMTLALADDAGDPGPFEISVRSKYLLDALKTLGEFRLEVTDSDRPLVLADDSTTHVIMPVNR